MASFGDLTTENTITGGTDSTTIGNIGDRLKVSSHLSYENDIENGDTFAHTEFHTLGNGGSLNHLIVTANNGLNVYFRYVTSPQSAGKVYFYEGATTSADGTLAPLLNQNRSSSKTSTTLIYHNATVTANGTTLQAESAGVTGNSRTGTETGIPIWILKPNTKYLLQYTSSASNNDFSEFFLVIEAI